MAKNSQNTQEQTVNMEGLAQIESAMRAAGLPESAIEAHMKGLRAQVIGPVLTETRDTFMNAMQKLAEKVPADVRQILDGKKISLAVTFNDGNISVEYTGGTVSRVSGGGGKRPVLVVEGLTFSTFEDLCVYKGLDTGKDSARRVYERASRKDGNAYPAPVEIDPEEYEANKEKLDAEHGISGPYVAS